MLLADSFQDPERARTIYLAAGGLMLIAGLIIAGTVWWWRSAAVEHPALAPLEIMGAKSFREGDQSDRRGRLDSVRPEGAAPGDTSLIVPDPVDLIDDDRTRPLDFDDLADDEVDDEVNDRWHADEPVPAGPARPRLADSRVARQAPAKPRLDDRKTDNWNRKPAPAPSRSQVPMDPLLRRPDND